MDKTTVILLVIVSGALICAVAAIVADALHVRGGNPKITPGPERKKRYSRTYSAKANVSEVLCEPSFLEEPSPLSLLAGSYSVPDPGPEPEQTRVYESPSYSLPEPISTPMQLEEPDPTPAPSYDPGPSLDAATFDSTPCDGGGSVGADVC